MADYEIPNITKWEPDIFQGTVFYYEVDMSVEPALISLSHAFHKGAAYNTTEEATAIYEEVLALCCVRRDATAILLANAPEALLETEYNPITRESIVKGFYPQVEPIWTLSEKEVFTFTIPGLRIEERPKIVEALANAFGDKVVLGG